MSEANDAVLVAHLRESCYDPRMWEVVTMMGRPRVERGWKEIRCVWGVQRCGNEESDHITVTNPAPLGALAIFVGFHRYDVERNGIIEPSWVSHNKHNISGEKRH